MPFETPAARSRAVSLGLFLVVTMAAWPSVALCSAGPDGIDVELADLDFLIGHWRGRGDPATAPEELWLPEREDVMAALFRWPSVGGRYVLELMTIARADDSVIFRFKHFGPDVVAWEKEEANTYVLVGLEDSCAAFRSAASRPGVPKGIEYCRTADRRLRFRAVSGDEPFDDASFVIHFDLVGESSEPHSEGPTGRH